MEILIVLVTVVGLLVLLSVAALRWGKDSSLESWLDGTYDPRYNWNSRQQPNISSQPPAFDNQNLGLGTNLALPLTKFSRN